MSLSLLYKSLNHSSLHQVTLPLFPRDNSVFLAHVRSISNSDRTPLPKWSIFIRFEWFCLLILLFGLPKTKICSKSLVFGRSVCLSVGDFVTKLPLVEYKSIIWYFTMTVMTVLTVLRVMRVITLVKLVTIVTVVTLVTEVTEVTVVTRKLFCNQKF